MNCSYLLFHENPQGQLQSRSIAVDKEEGSSLGHVAEQWHVVSLSVHQQGWACHTNFSTFQGGTNLGGHPLPTSSISRGELGVSIVLTTLFLFYSPWDCFISRDSCYSFAQLYLQPHGLQHTIPRCPSPSSEVCPSSCPLHWWCPSSHLILCHPLLPSIMRSIRDFSSQSSIHIRWPI